MSDQTSNTMSGDKSLKTKLIEAKEKQAKAVEMRKAGATYAQIAKQLGYAGHTGARKAVLSALRAIIIEPAAELRALELERLDALLVALNKPLKEGHLGAIDRALKIAERRAKLLGLDAPAGSLTYNLDLSRLSDDQLERVAAGENPLDVLLSTASHSRT